MGNSRVITVYSVTKLEIPTPFNNTLNIVSLNSKHMNPPNTAPNTDISKKRSANCNLKLLTENPSAL